jgi:hypothetical protein
MTKIDSIELVEISHMLELISMDLNTPLICENVIDALMKS